MTAEPETITDGTSSLAIFRDAPPWKDLRTAALGRLKLKSAEGGADLFAQATAALKAEGFQAVIGPMDGDTWHAYRAVTETDGSPAFLMEPASGEHDVRVLEKTGLEPIGGYVSKRVATRDAIGERPEVPAGVEIVNWDGERPEDFFGEVYDFSVEGFARNAFYKPITRDAFLGLYMPYVPFLKRKLIFFARTQDGGLAGFLFGIPDYAKGPQPDTAILKTYASGLRGVGHLLADAFHRNALEMGYETTIHALMSDENISRDRSGQHGAEIFRRYTLFGRAL